MNAAQFDGYGSPNRISVRDVPAPQVGADGILVRVQGVGMNPLDWHYVRGTPRLLLRMQGGFLKPKNNIPGVDISGIVEEIGSAVTEFQVGDEVFGLGEKGCATFSRMTAKNIVKKLDEISFLEAACIPVPGLTALQSLRDKCGVQPNERVLIIGASGGVGVMAVQLAKYFGAHVTAVCSGRNVELVKSLGADVVLDYTSSSFTYKGLEFDAILDCIGSASIFQLTRILSKSGRIVPIGGKSGGWVSPFPQTIFALIYGKIVRRRVVPIIAKNNREDLNFLGNLVATKKLKIVISEKYPLDATGAALAKLEQGHVAGKIVIDPLMTA